MGKATTQQDTDAVIAYGVALGEASGVEAVFGGVDLGKPPATAEGL
jgi:hypothetical protein